MNTADHSIALMDAALRRRFYFAPFFPNKSPIKGLLRRWLAHHGQDTLAADLVDKANEKLEQDAGIGPSYFMGGQNLDEARIERIWNRAVIPYVEEQCFGETEKLEALAYKSLKRQLPGMPTAEMIDPSGEDTASPQAGDDAADA